MSKAREEAAQEPTEGPAAEEPPAPVLPFSSDGEPNPEHEEAVKAADSQGSGILSFDLEMIVPLGVKK